MDKKLPILSLKRRGADLADPRNQLRVLEEETAGPDFGTKLNEHSLEPLAADGIDILQVNVGKLCNMTCAHCHVDAGPDRREIMTRETIDQCLSAIEVASISTVDLTGGAPEMNPDFKYFVSRARELGAAVIDRCNLTILLANGYQDMPKFLSDNHVEIVASLPCYLEENADEQRGDGSFRKSIEALKLLNSFGYGQGDPDRMLTLVYNPVGPSLPPDQAGLEEAYRRELDSRYQIKFDRLFTITNMPISRYLEHLLDTEKYDEYMAKLIDAFNPTAARGVMCRKMLSVGWDGQLFDCDFNQMLELSPGEGMPAHIADFDRDKLSNRQIMTGRHCFGCTAAAGSGCLGAIEG